MAFTVTINGVPITCESASDAIELARLASNGLASQTPRKHHTPRRGPGRPPKNGATAVRKDKEKLGVSRTLGFLQAIAKAGRSGVTGSDIMAALELVEPRAVGGTIVRANRTLEKIAFNPTTVFRTIKTPHGRKWLPRKMLGEAINRLQKKLEGGGL